MRLSALPRSPNNHTPNPSTVCLWSNGKAQIPLGSNKEQLILLMVVKERKSPLKESKILLIPFKNMDESKRKIKVTPPTQNTY